METAEEIAELEAEIGRLSDEAEACRLLIRVAKLAVAGSIALFFAAYAGLLTYPGPASLLGLALFLGGIVVGGSNKSTLDQALAGIAHAEAARRKLIDEISFEGQREPLEAQIIPWRPRRATPIPDRETGS